MFYNTQRQRHAIGAVNILYVTCTYLSTMLCDKRFGNCILNCIHRFIYRTCSPPNATYVVTVTFSTLKNGT